MIFFINFDSKADSPKIAIEDMIGGAILMMSSTITSTTFFVSCRML
jgi:hypothetical protein